MVGSFSDGVGCMRFPFVSRKKFEEAQRRAAEIEKKFEAARVFAWDTAMGIETMRQLVVAENLSLGDAGFCNDALLIASFLDGQIRDRLRKEHKERIAA